MPSVGFEPLTLGLTSSDEDHYPMPLPHGSKYFKFRNVGQASARQQLVANLVKSSESAFVL